MHEIIVVDNADMCADTMMITVDCIIECPMLPADTTVQLMDCTDIYNLCLPDISMAEMVDYEIYDNGTLYQGNINLCNSNNGISIELPVGLHEIIAIDTVDMCSDTMTIVVDCNIVCPTMPADMNVDLADCLDTYELCFEDLPLADIGGYEIYDNGVLYTAPFNECNMMNGTSITLGVGMHEIILVDTFGICMDTVNIGLTCASDTILCQIDTIILGEQVLSLCPADYGYTDNFDSVTDVCADPSNPAVDITIDPITGCVDYTGIEVGQETICLEFCENSICDTVKIQIDVIEFDYMLPDIVDTIKVDSSVTICVTDLGFTGTLGTITNVCEDQSGMYVDFEIDITTGCITYTGLMSVGTEVGCFEICDIAGNCDTSTFTITVLDTLVAITDYGTTMENTPVVIPILVNDTLPNDPPSITIVSGPSNGMVEINVDSTVTYTPDLDFCGLDSFVYEICDNVDCDTATVYITVICDELIIYNGVSPNADGLNDYWHIEGIEFYDRVTICIFNRWGNRVFYVEDGPYNNDPNDDIPTFDGIWNGYPLPDGTYFYTVDLLNGTEIYKGYIQIHR